MSTLHLKQKTIQKFTAQQIQFMNLLQLPAPALKRRIVEELTENPVLTAVEEEIVSEDLSTPEALLPYTPSHQLTMPASSVDHLISNQMTKELSVHEELFRQLAFLPFNEEALLVAQHIIGKLTAEGYLPSPLELIVEELALIYNKEVSLEQVVWVVARIQEAGPLGIAVPNLQAFLLLQLRHTPSTVSRRIAERVVRDHFDALSKRNYAKILKQCHLSHTALREALNVITKLRPYPILPATNSEKVHMLNPDFLIHVQGNKTTVSLVDRSLPRLTIGKTYKDLLLKQREEQSKASKACVTFIQDKINRAKWFMQAIALRKRTLLRIMTAIVALQKRFFITGDRSLLVPIFLRHVAAYINMDVSTVSRAINQKSVQTHGHVYELKYFFSEPIQMQDGKCVSNRVVQQVIANHIAQEHKLTPYTDEEITATLQHQGYQLARRTVAKYRQQLGIPVARLRKEFVLENHEKKGGNS